MRKYSIVFCINLVFCMIYPGFDCNNSSKDQNSQILGNNFSLEESFSKLENEQNGICEPTFFDKWQILFEQGKNATINKHVEHINQTFDALETFKHNVQYLFQYSISKREQQKALEFISNIDLVITSVCLSALTSLIKAIGDNEIWALKCSFEKLTFFKSCSFF